MERDPNEGGRDVGRDIARDLSDEPPPAIRDAPPDILSPIDESSPVSGHTPPPETTVSAVDSPEHDWGLARELVRPAFRPVGTSGLPIETVDRESLSQHAMQSHPQPLIDLGPAGLPVVYTHCGRWVRHPDQRRPPAVMGHRAVRAPGRGDGEPRRLGGRARRGPTRSGDRRVISSDTGDGFDAVRILLPDAIAAPAARAGRRRARVLVGIPERHLLARRPCAPTTRGSRRCSVSSSSSSRAARTSRSTAGCSSSSTVDWSSSLGGRGGRVTDGLRVEVDGPVATLTLDRP